MVDEFWDWLWREFCPSIWDAIIEAMATTGKVIANVIAWAILIVLLAITSPLWTPPFIYWYFVKWRKREEEGAEYEEN